MGDHVRDFVRFDEPLQQRLRSVPAHELALRLVPWQRLVDQLVDEVLDACGVRRPRDDGVDGDTGTRGVLCESA